MQTHASISTVTSLADAGPGSLRQVMADAAVGDTITFDVTGTITLTSGELVVDRDLTILGPGSASLAISGNGATRIFSVQTNMAFTMANLTVAQGQSTNGGSIYNDGGTVTLLGSTLRANLATNAYGDAYGGAVFNHSGVVNATNCAFVENGAKGGAGIAATVSPFPSEAARGGDARGGAVFSRGTFNATRCSFLRNQAQGGTGGAGQCYLPPWPSEVYPFGGAPGGAADGAAICNSGVMVISQSLLASNRAEGGMGGAGAAGGQGYPCGPYAFGTPGGGGGHARGAVACNAGDASLVNCTLAWNTASGGLGASGGVGGSVWCHGGGQTAGGEGGDGGNGFGAIYSPDASLALVNCTVAENAGIGGGGGTSGGDGYLIYYDPPDNPEPTIVVWPAPPDGTDGISIGGIAQTGSLLNTLLTSNHPVNGHGVIIDLGHNLSSDDSCTLTNSGSLSSVDPKLGLLADNGGPTYSMALLPGSPAVDLGDTAAAPETDQRGLPRPYGQAADIGAFEYWLTAKALLCPTGGVDIVALGIEGQSCCLLASTNLMDWVPAGTNAIGTDWTGWFHDNVDGEPQRFYRLMPVP